MQMLNFTVGPVQMDEETMNLGKEPVPYFRTEEFSKIMLKNEQLICNFAKTEEESRAVFITGSGTASMEASVLNFFNNKDKILVVNGGSFGTRFVQICETLKLNYSEIKLSIGESLEKSQLSQFENKGYTALVLQHHETSTGVLYDLSMVGEFCKKNNLFLLVDCISSFLAEEIDMQKMKIDAIIIGSQKAIALPPGISCIIMNKRGVERVYNNNISSVYFDLKSYLKDGERGQTPFTPAVQILLQLHEKLNRIEREGGTEKLILEVKKRAEYFRNSIHDLPFTLVAKNPSHAVTALFSKNLDAKKILNIMKDEYHIWLCPNGGELANTIFRVGHIGTITKQQMDLMICALQKTVNKLRG